MASKIASFKTIHDLVAAQDAVYADQKERGSNASLEAAAFKLSEEHFDSIVNVSTRRSCQNRFKRYVEFCAEHATPPFPIVAPVVALSLYDLADGDPENGKAYDSHVTSLNAIRRGTFSPFVGQPGCQSVSENLMDYDPLRSFCTIARSAAANKRTGGTPAKTPQKLTASKSARNLAATPSKAPTTPSRARATTPKPTPKPTPKSASKGTTSARAKRVASDVPSSSRKRTRESSVFSSGREDAEEDEGEKTPRRKRVKATTEEESTPRKSTRGAAATRQSTRITRAKAEVPPVPVEIKEEEVVVPAAVVGDGDPEGVGMFGRIVRWFGWSG
ncbi:hypothetical protein MNV49_000124 [Pseudohyphozyma bogoriensis]|nr:hypothetical protein MNV49_000124 [Pseudohyphozyma bogoriensis]